MKRIFWFFTLLVGFIAVINAQEIINKGRFSGYMFGDYFYNAARDSGITSLANTANGGEKDFNGFQFRRIYFAYDYTISESFSTRFRLEADQSANTSNNKIGVFVKDAYLKWSNIFKGSDFIFGIQPTPTWGVSEGVWGNRFLEKTIMDLRGIASSRDFGISLKGKFDSDGVFKYWAMIGNNSGNRAEVDKYKRFYAHIQYTPIKQLTAAVYADFKARPNIADPTNTADQEAMISNNDWTYALFLGYKEKDLFTLGVEGYLNPRENGMVSNGSLKDRTGMGISAFASYNFSKELAAVGRYDFYDPNTDVDGDSRNWFIFSLNYKPDEKVTISPNVVIETYESIPNGRSIDASITPRITFFYTFL